MSDTRKLMMLSGTMAALALQNLGPLPPVAVSMPEPTPPKPERRAKVKAGRKQRKKQ
jgi:hypothetical protein